MFQATLRVAAAVFAALVALALVGCCGGNDPSAAGAPGNSLAPATAPAADPVVKTRMVVTHPADNRVVTQPWGELRWVASAPLGNCGTMTVGKATLKPGIENPKHVHPNCDEVLYVVSGTILHRTETGEYVKMTAGDTITIPAGVVHNAKNVGSEDAVMFISFSSGWRKAVNQ